MSVNDLLDLIDKDRGKKSGIFGLLLVPKNNQPKAGSYSTIKAERLRKLIEYLKSTEGKRLGENLIKKQKSDS